MSFKYGNLNGLKVSLHLYKTSKLQNFTLLPLRSHLDACKKDGSQVNAQKTKCISGYVSTRDYRTKSLRNGSQQIFRKCGEVEQLISERC